MFVVTLSKASVKKLGVGAMCCALVVFSAMLGRYISTRSVAVAAAGNKIESAQDIQTWFTGYGLDVDGASITADKVKIPRKWSPPRPTRWKPDIIDNIERDFLKKTTYRSPSTMTPS